MTYGMFEMPVEKVLRHPHVLIGDHPRIADLRRQRREEYGFNYVTIRYSALDAFAPVVTRLAGR